MTAKRIFKYTTAPFADKVAMKEGAAVLSVGVQGDWLQLWAEVDPEAPITFHPVSVVPTGGEVPDGQQFVGTAQLPDGTVWHVYAESVTR